MTKLEIDPQKRTIYAELNLKGESQPITVQVTGYELSESSGKTFLKISTINLSREWMQVAVQHYLAGKAFEVPDMLRVLLS